jgi:CheY-like chemotaxis protein
MTNPPSPHPPVLVVDTDTAHTELVRQSLAAARLLNPVLDCHDADVALSYLRGLGVYADRDTHPVPSVVIASFDLPDQGGQRVLRGVRESLLLRGTPVIAIGSAADEDGIHEAHRLGATAYLARPLASSVILDVISGLGMPWSLTGLQATS